MNALTVQMETRLQRYDKIKLYSEVKHYDWMLQVTFGKIDHHQKHYCIISEKTSTKKSKKIQ